MKKAIIIKGQGLGFKRQMETQYVQSLCSGGCSITLNEAEAKQFDTLEEAQAVINGRHACGNFVAIEIELPYTAAEEQEWNDSMEVDAAFADAYDASKDVDTKYYGFNADTTQPFNLFYDACLNHIQYLIKNGKGKEAAALRVKLTEANINHNQAPQKGGLLLPVFFNQVAVAA